MKYNYTTGSEYSIYVKKYLVFKKLNAFRIKTAEKSRSLYWTVVSLEDLVISIVKLSETRNIK